MKTAADIARALPDFVRAYDGETWHRPATAREGDAVVARCGEEVRMSHQLPPVGRRAGLLLRGGAVYMGDGCMAPMNECCMCDDCERALATTPREERCT